MTRKKKTPDFLKELINRHFETVEWVEEVLRVKRTVAVENQAPHVREKPEEYWTGVAHGAANMLEAALHCYGCYAGFMHLGEKKTQTCSDGSVSTSRSSVKPGDEGYTSWRVMYFTR